MWTSCSGIFHYLRFPFPKIVWNFGDFIGKITVLTDLLANNKDDTSAIYHLMFQVYGKCGEIKL